jgi:hypothetical protein
MSSIFVSRSPAPQTKEQKKISSLVLKPSSAAKKRMLPGACVVVYKKPETEVKE